MSLILLGAAWMSLGGFFSASVEPVDAVAVVAAEQEQEPDTDLDAEQEAEPKSRVLKMQKATADLVLEAEANSPAPQRNGRQNAGSVTTNGITTTNARDANRDIRIIEDPQSGIVIEVTRHYGPRDLDQLKKKHPELVDYVQLFPRQLGNHEIELNLAIKTVYRAANLERLRELHPEAFNIYRRHRGQPRKQ